MQRLEIKIGTMKGLWATSGWEKKTMMVKDYEMSNMNELLITGTYLPPKSIQQATRVSLDGKTRNHIDYLSISNWYRSAEIY